MPKAIRLNTAKDPTLHQTTMSRFRGVDLSSGESAVAEYRSPDAPNMMPDRDGYPVKRPGYTVQQVFDGAVHGAYSLTLEGVRKDLIHAGTSLYLVSGDGAEELCSNMADATSRAWQLQGKLWIVDGTAYRYFDGNYLGYVSDIATVPVITISKAPNGEDGATSYKPVNLLTGKKTESYLGTDSDKDYYTSFQELYGDVTVEVMDADGNWIKDTTGTLSFTGTNGKKTVTWTVDRDLGKITFSEALPPVVVGEDNVRITYTTDSEEHKIDKMRLGILYGVNGAMDRLFLSGNPEEPATDRWSEWQDPTYFGDTFYSQLGQDGAPIVGYTVLADALVTHKRGEENGRNAFVRTGTLDEDGFAVFAITNVIQGEGALAESSFQSFRSEPVFLTSEGVFAMTPSDVTGERYTQLRSYYVNGAMLRSEDLENACSCVWGRFYVLGTGGRLYLLDGEQKSYESKSPNSNYQYEGYYFTGINATALWTDAEGRLCWGTADGRLCRMNEAGKATAYEDDGAPVEAWWTTPLMELDTWSNKKNIKGVWVVAMPYARSSGQIYYATDRENEKLVREYATDIFDFNDIDFDRFTFNTLDRPSSIATGKKAKKAKVFQVKVKNAAMEPFGIIAITMQYTVGGRIKK